MPLPPISPPPETGRGERELPAYVSNGLIGLRVREVPLAAGMAVVSGFAGEHPERRIEAIAAAPYPLAGDLAVDAVWLSDRPHQVQDLAQSYDFATGELVSRFSYVSAGVTVACEILTFASREDPTLVCQGSNGRGCCLRPSGQGYRGCFRHIRSGAPPFARNARRVRAGV